MGFMTEKQNNCNIEVKKYPWLEVKFLLASVSIFMIADFSLRGFSHYKVNFFKIGLLWIILFGAAVILLNIISLLLSLVVKLVLRKTALRVIFNNIASFVALVLIDVALAYASVEVLEHYL